MDIKYNFFALCVELKKNHFIDIAEVNSIKLDEIIDTLQSELNKILKRTDINNILNENIDMITYARRKLYNRILEKTFMINTEYKMEYNDIDRMCNAFSRDLQMIITDEDLLKIKVHLYHLLVEFNNKNYSILFYKLFILILDVITSLFNNINCLNIKNLYNKKNFLTRLSQFLNNTTFTDFNINDITRYKKIDMQLIYHFKDSQEIIMHPIYNDQNVDFKINQLYKYSEDMCRKLLDNKQIEIITDNKVHALLLMQKNQYEKIKHNISKQSEYCEIYDICYQNINDSLVIPNCKNNNKLHLGKTNLSQHFKDLLSKKYGIIKFNDYIILYTENRGWSNYNYDDTTYKNLPGGRRNYIFDATKNIFRDEELYECLKRELIEELYLNNIEVDILEINQIKLNTKYCIVKLVDSN